MREIKVEQEDAEWTFLLSPSHFFLPSSACVIIIVFVYASVDLLFRFKACLPLCAHPGTYM